MSISKELEAKILRYHFVEKWGVNTIAVQMGIHHTTVDRVLCQAGMPKAERARRPSIVDPYYPMILEELAKYPRLSATRLLSMARIRGYQGGSSQFRAHVAQLRPRKAPEAYLRLKTLPGDQGQVDWGAFGHVHIGRAKRPLMAFVIVLSWSRKIFLRFYLNQRMDNFLRGHVAAFDHWNGLPRVLLYDNLKSAVLERSGDAIRFHPTLLDLATHYRFEPRPCAPYRGNEKGRVERGIRYIRSSFFVGREWSDIDDLNAQALQWCESVACERRCPEDPDITVGQAFEQEQASLITLPDNPYPTHERVEASVGKTPYVRFDLNDYSLPHTAVRRGVTVIATLKHITVHQDGTEIANHPRSFGKGEQIENNDHVAALVAMKKQARHERGQDRLATAAPTSVKFLPMAIERGHRLGSTIAQLEAMLDQYQATELEAALAEVILRDSAHPQSVRQVLEQRREARNEPPPLALPLSRHEQLRTLAMQPASLAGYARFTATDSEQEELDDDNNP